MRCINMKWIQIVFLKIQSRHDSVHKWTDGRTSVLHIWFKYQVKLDASYSAPTYFMDKVKPVYPTFNVRWRWRYNYLSVRPAWTRPNLLWPGDAIWLHRARSTLPQVMACCLTAPSHYLNQCWPIISDVLWHSLEGNFCRYLSLSWVWQSLIWYCNYISQGRKS